MNDNYVQATVHRLLSLPLLPPSEIVAGIEDIRLAISSDSQFAEELYQLITYIQRQWITKRSIGPDRLSVCDNQTNNVLESYHSSMKRRIKVNHPNLFTFLGHLQRATVDYTSDVARVTNEFGLHIRRPKKKRIFLTNQG